VVTALLYGGLDFAKSIGKAVQAGFDTDCNGATVGSIVGMMVGARNIPDEWVKPFNNLLDTSIFGVGTVSVDELVGVTLE
jgi:ADP-ribosylglycohydrolase